jgi:serine protease Do
MPTYEQIPQKEIDRRSERRPGQWRSQRAAMGISADRRVELIKMIKPANVLIIAASGSPDGFSRESGVSLGSGVAVRKNAILTNRHVVRGVGEDAHVFVQVADREEPVYVPPQDIVEHPTQDLAYIRLSSKILYPLEFGNANQLEEGQDLLAIGNPLGRVDIVHPVICGPTFSIPIEDGGAPQIFRQLAGAINTGNSGGPTVDERGRIVGINTMKFGGGEGMAGMIPIEVIVPFAATAESRLLKQARVAQGSRLPFGRFLRPGIA